MDGGSVPRRQPWVLDYRIKIGVPIRFPFYQLTPSILSKDF